MSKIKGEYGVDVPHEARQFISYKARKVAFKQIYEGYPKRYPNLNLMWAYLNYDKDIPVDYAIIYSGRNADDSGDLVLYLVEPPFSDRSTPGYKHCKRTMQTKRFFEYGLHDMVIMEREKFFEFLDVSLQFNKDKKSPNYWKLRENSKKLAKALLDLALYDTRTDLVRSNNTKSIKSS